MNTTIKRILLFVLRAADHLLTTCIIISIGFAFGRIYSDFDLQNLPKSIPNNFLLDKSTLDDQLIIGVMFLFVFIWSISMAIVDPINSEKKQNTDGVSV